MTSLFSSANEKMDRNAEDRFTWRLFLGVMQFLIAIRGVHAFVNPHPVISAELCFATFLITFFTLVVEMNQTPEGRRFIVQASAEDRQGRWTVTLERERFERSNQERSAIEAQANRAQMERLFGSSGAPTEDELLERYRLDRNDPYFAVNPLTGRQALLPQYTAGLSYRESHVLDENGVPYGGNPPDYLSLIPSNGRTITAMVQSLPSPGSTSGEFIGLTDQNNRHHPIHFQVIPSSPPPAYIDSTNQDQDVVVYLRPQSQHRPYRRSSEPTFGTGPGFSSVRRAAALSIHRSSSDSPLADPIFRSNN